MAVRRILSQDLKQKFHIFQSIRASTKNYATAAKAQKPREDRPASKRRPINPAFSNYQYVYPEFLPDPNPTYRNWIREKLERKDMVARRSQVNIPEFYVGSILAVQYSERHAPKKVNRFVGICIERKGCGLRATINLRNVIDHQGVEVVFCLYDPCIIKIECLRLEKRLDTCLRYLRDAPEEYSAVPVDMEAEYLPEGSPIPVNDVVVPLKPPPYIEKYWLQNFKGITNIEIGYNATKRWIAHQTPWEKYDLMKTYREAIPQEQQNSIFSEIYKDLNEMEERQRKETRARMFGRKKTK